MKSSLSTSPIAYAQQVVHTKTSKLFWMLIGLTLLGSLYVVVTRGAAVEWLLTCLSVMTLLVSYVLPLVASRGLEVKRVWSSPVVENDTIVVDIEIARKWRIPGVWFGCVEVISNESEVNVPPLLLQQQFTPLFHRAMTQSYRLRQLGRGQYKSESVTILVGDVLGLTTIKKVINLPLSFVVLPQALAEQEQTYLSRLTTQKWSKQLAEHMNHDTPSLKNAFYHPPQYSGESSTVLTDIKPYSEGDSIHRIYYHALSRGMGVQVLEEKEQLTAIKQVLFIDQYLPPMTYDMALQQFNTLIGWILYKVEKQLAFGPVLVVTDNWCYECYELYQLDELRRLLAQIKPDVQYSIVERLHSLAKILPSHSQLVVYTADWKNSEGWIELAQLAWHKKATVNLQLLSEHRIMTYTMREQQREFEQSGLNIEWRFSNYSLKQNELVREGSERYAYN